MKLKTLFLMPLSKVTSLLEHVPTDLRLLGNRTASCIERTRPERCVKRSESLRLAQLIARTALPPPGGRMLSREVGSIGLGYARRLLN